jgi:RHS repeat-associated protein
MPGRSFVSSGYRYGFNGKENDPESVGTGEGLQDYGMRIYNPSLGRFLSVDPLTKKYPELTPYQFASNRPIVSVDVDGLEATPLASGAESVAPPPSWTIITATGSDLTTPGHNTGDFVNGLTSENRGEAESGAPPNPASKPQPINWANNPTQQDLIDKTIEVSEWASAYNSGIFTVGDFFPNIETQTIPGGTGTITVGMTNYQAQISFPGLTDASQIDVLTMGVAFVNPINVGSSPAALPTAGTTNSYTSLIGFSEVSALRVATGNSIALDITETETFTGTYTNPLPGMYVANSTTTDNASYVAAYIGTRINNGMAFGDRMYYHYGFDLARSTPINTRSRYGVHYFVTPVR